MFRRSWTECEAVDFKDHATHGVKDEGSFAVYASVADDQGLETGLLTGPMFGCIKFQPKPVGAA